MIIFDVLKAPKMTEKTLSLKEETNQYAFEVDPRANKIPVSYTHLTLPTILLV